MVMESAQMVADEEVLEVLDDKIEVQDAAVEEDSAEDNAGFDEVKVRENFAETAFFEPHLLTDNEGNISVEFTVPESLTKWHF